MKTKFQNWLTLSLLGVAFSFTTSEVSNWLIEKKYQVKFYNNSVAGEFLGFSGVINFSPDNFKEASFSLTVNPKTVNTGNTLQNKHIQNKDWLETDKYPLINFKSSEFIKSDTGYVVNGDLEMHGVVKRISIPFVFNEKGKKKASIFAKFSFNRFDFGIGNPKDGVDSVLTIETSLPLKKKV